VDAIKFAVSQCDGQTIKFKKADLIKGKLTQINMNVAADMMLRKANRAMLELYETVIENE